MNEKIRTKKDIIEELNELPEPIIAFSLSNYNSDTMSFYRHSQEEFNNADKVRKKRDDLMNELHSFTRSVKRRWELFFVIKVFPFTFAETKKVRTRIPVRLRTQPSHQ